MKKKEPHFKIEKKRNPPGWVKSIINTNMVDVFHLFYSTPAIAGHVGTLQKTLNSLTHYAFSSKDIKEAFKSDNPTDFLSGVVAVLSIVLTASLKNRSRFVLTKIPLIIGLEFGIIFALKFVIKDREIFWFTKFGPYISTVLTPTVSYVTKTLMNYTFDKFLRRYIAPTVDKIKLDSSLKIDNKIIGKIITGLLVGFIAGIASVVLVKLIIDHYNERKNLEKVSFKEFALRYIREHFRELIILGIISSLIGAGLGGFLGKLVSEIGEDERAKELVKILELGAKKVKIPPNNKLNLNKIFSVVDKIMSILEPIATKNSGAENKYKEIEGKTFLKIPVKGTKFVILVEANKIKKKDKTYLEALEKLKKALKILDQKVKKKAKEIYENLPERIYVILIKDSHFNAFSYNGQLIGIYADRKFYKDLTPEEIAAILAHELNHSYRNHAALGTAVRFTLLTYALLMAFAALFIKAKKGTQKGFYIPARAILPLLIASNYNYFVFNRFMEMESDAFAADVMGDAALRVMSKMYKRYGKYDYQIPFDEIHGKLSYRVKEIKNRLKKTTKE